MTPIFNTNNKIDNKQAFAEKKSETKKKLLNTFNEMKGNAKFTMTEKVNRQMDGLIKKGYLDEDFRRVVSNAMRDEHHVENGLKYITPEFITRPDIFERYLNASTPIKENKSRAFQNVI